MNLISKKLETMSAPRSGSTFINQILKCIFTNVKNTHDYNQNAEIIIFRNFLDSAISLHRVRYGKENNFIISNKKDIHLIVNDYQKSIAHIKSYFKSLTFKNKMFMVYDYDIMLNGNNNYEKIFKMIEDYFLIKISHEQRSMIIKNTNIDINKKRAEKFKDFKSWDKDTLIHGNHINTGSINSWKNHITEDLHLFYKNTTLFSDYEYCLRKIEYYE